MTPASLHCLAELLRREMLKPKDPEGTLERVKTILGAHYLVSFTIRKGSWSIRLDEKGWPKANAITVQLTRQTERTLPQTLELLAEAVELLVVLKESRGKTAVAQAFAPGRT
jgi:hypothetical protein